MLRRGVEYLAGNLYVINSIALKIKSNNLPPPPEGGGGLNLKKNLKALQKPNLPPLLRRGGEKIKFIKSFLFY